MKRVTVLEHHTLVSFDSSQSYINQLEFDYTIGLSVYAGICTAGLQGFKLPSRDSTIELTHHWLIFHLFVCFRGSNTFPKLNFGFVIWFLIINYHIALETIEGPYYNLGQAQTTTSHKGTSINNVTKILRFLTSLPLCHTDMTVLLRPSYIVSQKC